MTTTKKITKRERFEALLKIEAVKADPGMVEFITHELDLLAKKNSADKKPTAQQEANATIKADILAVMEANPNQLFTVSELLKKVPNLPDTMTNQRMSALVRQMVDAGSVKRTEDKRKAFFSLV